MASIVVVSDSHLSVGDPGANHNWDAVVAHVERRRPELVIHAGDLSGHGFRSPVDLLHATNQLARLSAPVLVAPGNHDVGYGDPDRSLTLARRAGFEQVVGTRHPVAELGRWTIVGLDTQALQSDHRDDEVEWEVAAERLATGRPTVVVLHRPIGPVTADEPESEHRYLIGAARDRLRRMVAEAGTVELVINGHTHQWRNVSVDGVWWLWAPSTWATVPDRDQPTIGAKRVGLVELDLDDPGSARLVRPDGMTADLAKDATPPVVTAG